MAKKLTLEELLGQFEPQIAQAFYEAVQDVTENVDFGRLVAALERGDLEDAMAALHLSPAAYARLEEAIRNAYLTAGDRTVVEIPRLLDGQGNAVVVRFDRRNYRAVAWLRDHSSAAVTRILEDQRSAIRTALASGMQEGVNPRTSALDIVGRTDRMSNQRSGGIIGLTEQQAEFAETAKIELRSGDPALLGNYLERTRRDKRFDSTVRKAIKAEQPVPADVAAKAVAAYKRRLLELRGQTIARTEAMTALQSAKHQAYQQLVDDGSVDEADIERQWVDSHDFRVRHTHRGLNGQRRQLNQAFVSPSGARLMYPGDPRAPAAERIGCRCDVIYRIKYLNRIT